MSLSFSRMLAAAAIVATGLAMTSASSAAYERNPIYAVGGNHFIVRAHRQGGYVYLRAYRQAGDQWERYGRTSIPIGEIDYRRDAVRAGGGSLIERIYFGARVVGYSDLDLDNPLYTDLNLGGPNCLRCK